MDPYIERGDLWPELHDRLMVYACDALQPLLPRNYVAHLELRIPTEYEPVSPSRVPDLELVRTGAGPGAAREERLEVPERGYWIEGELRELRETWISIRSLPEQELVTSVELLSPSNKRGEPRA
jgi:hypothetical protein